MDDHLHTIIYEDSLKEGEELKQDPEWLQEWWFGLEDSTRFDIINWYYDAEYHLLREPDQYLRTR